MAATIYWEGKAALYQISYDTGSNTPVVGETLNVVGSADETCVIQAWTVASGSWAGNDAAGLIWVYSASTAFVTNFASGDDLENAADTTLLGSASEEVLHTGDWSAAGNWGTGEDPAVPVTDDTVIFDGRSATSVVDNTASNDQTGVDLAAFHIKASYTGSIATAALPLIIECKGLMWIQGTGSYYIQCGNDANDADILTTIIDTSGSVFLSSQKNASGAGKVSLFSTIHAVQGTVTLYGGADDKGDDSVGTAFTTLNIIPSGNRGGLVTLTIGDECEDFKTPAAGTIYMREGTANIYTDLLALNIYGGTCNIGGNAYDMDAGDDNVATINIYGGTVNWKTTNVTTAGTTTATDTASESPAITALNLYGGTFSAIDMQSTLTTAATITTLTQYPGSSVNLDNGYSNIIVTTYTKRGGELTTGPGQAITLA